MKEECYQCVNRRDVTGNAHIKCISPDAEMTGDPHGIKNGWFIYPFLFDPVWKTKSCSNFVDKNSVSVAVSNSVSPENESHVHAVNLEG